MTDEAGAPMDAYREACLKDIRGAAGSALDGRRIVLAVTGSIAVLEAPRLARELMRQGADVWVCMSEAAAGIVTPAALQWCTGNPVVTEIGGWVEHLFLAGAWEGRGDLLLVAPATSNTIAKMAHGIDDTVVCTVAVTAIGAGVPVLVAPGMHACMAEHPAFRGNLDRLRSFGVEIVEPLMAEGKAKMAPVETIVDAVMARLGPRDLEGRRVLITAGPTVEFLDPVRVVTNLSSGKMGVALAREAVRRGACVTLVYGPGSAAPPAGVEVVRVTTGADMLNAVRAHLGSRDADVSIFAAAVSDFAPHHPEATKVPTERGGTWTVELVPTPKIIEEARRLSRGVVVAFKAEAADSDEALLHAARAHAARNGADLTVANRVGPGRGFLQDDNEVYVLGADGFETHVPRADKAAVARRIWDEAARLLRSPARNGRSRTGPESTPAASPSDGPSPR